MRTWVFKVNTRLYGWHFESYFRYRGRQAYPMGGREWIRSPSSSACLRRVRRGDLFVCYQTDERKIYGLARAATPPATRAFPAPVASTRLTSRRVASAWPTS